MAVLAKIKDTEFGVGDRIRVIQRIKDGDKSREASFEGMVISIKGRGISKTFMVRKIAEGNIGVERIFPFEMPSIDRIIVVKRGVEGVRRAKLYYTRTKSPTEIEMIFKRAAVKRAVKAPAKKSKPPKKAPSKKK